MHPLCLFFLSHLRFSWPPTTAFSFHLPLQHDSHVFISGAVRILKKFLQFGAEIRIHIHLRRTPCAFKKLNRLALSLTLILSLTQHLLCARVDQLIVRLFVHFTRNNGAHTNSTFAPRNYARCTLHFGAFRFVISVCLFQSQSPSSSLFFIPVLVCV